MKNTIKYSLRPTSPVEKGYEITMESPKELLDKKDYVDPYAVYKKELMPENNNVAHSIYIEKLQAFYKDVDKTIWNVLAK